MRTFVTFITTFCPGNNAVTSIFSSCSRGEEGVDDDEDDVLCETEELECLTEAISLALLSNF